MPNPKKRILTSLLACALLLLTSATADAGGIPQSAFATVCSGAHCFQQPQVELQNTYSTFVAPQRSCGQQFQQPQNVVIRRQSRTKQRSSFAVQNAQNGRHGGFQQPQVFVVNQQQRRQGLISDGLVNDVVRLSLLRAFLR